MPTLIASPTPGANPQCTLTLLLLLLQSSSIRTVLYTYTNSCVRGRPLVNCWQHSLLSSLSLHPTHTNTAQFPTHTDTLTHSHAAVQQNPQSSFHELNPHQPTYKLHPRGTCVNSTQLGTVDESRMKKGKGKKKNVKYTNKRIIQSLRHPYIHPSIFFHFLVEQHNIHYKYTAVRQQRGENNLSSIKRDADRVD